MVSETSPLVTEAAGSVINGSDIDAPYTAKDLVFLAALVLCTPWFTYAPLFFLAAFIRTYPEQPHAWFGFWVALLTLSVVFPCTLFLLLPPPHVLRERWRKRFDSSSIESAQEQYFFWSMKISVLIGFVVAAWDGVGREDSFPKWVNCLGASLVIVFYAEIMFVLRANKYASTTVYKQEGQRLVTTGRLYGTVRHPMYTGLIVMFPAFSLALGSYWGLLPMILVDVSLLWRINHEEDFLVQEFGDEYEKYRQVTKYKVIPFVV
jgi:protein-S-isoprenylcysteine O-methyltransferase Ste14